MRTTDKAPDVGIDGEMKMKTTTVKPSVTLLTALLLVPAAMLQGAADTLARPTPEQVAWHDMELEMFIHFAPSTWQDTQHDNLSTPLSAINPEKLDTEQWADVAVAMGAKQIVFVAKHVGGFCWWQTDTTDYSVKNMYYRSVGHGAVLLLNHTPDTTGRIPEADAKRAAEFGAEIQRRFGKSLAETTGRGNTVELDLGKSTRLDHVITAEDIREGERVREYVLEGFADGAWHQLCEGTAIGHKKIDRFAPVEVSKLRLRVTRAAAEPLIRRLAAFSVWGERMPVENAGEMASVTQTVWRWSADNVKADWTTVQIPLTLFCKDAGVYVLEFPRTAGKDLEVQSLHLIARGQKLDKFVVRRNVRGTTQYHITITEEGTEVAVEVIARLADSAGAVRPRCAGESIDRQEVIRPNRATSNRANGETETTLKSEQS